ncbi:MAG: cytochrome b [Gammaproteobacteria bacterium]|nr:MAG: cytochrome b [Gammaproteobacteria bacterium]RTZ74999.1 MAG: cytochrome b [Gammaproteobacteria bacterium]
MQWLDSRRRWGRVTLILHWLLALGIALMLGLGLWMVRLDYYHPLYQALPALHRDLGLLLAPLLLFRLLWRGFNARPELAGARWEKGLARFVQAMLLVVPILMVVSGYLVSTADGRPVSVLGLFEVPAPRLEIERLEDKAGAVHAWLGYLLLGLIGLHVAGALKHHFRDRDTTLTAMLGMKGDIR